MSSPHQPSESLTDEQLRQFTGIMETIENLLDEGAVSEVFEFLGENLAVLGEDAEQRGLRAALLLVRAELALDQDDLAMALEDAELVLTLDVDSSAYAAAHGMAGWVHLYDEVYTVAHDRFVDALELVPDEVMYLHGLALAFMELEEFENAIAQLTRAIEIDDENADMFALRSEIYLHLEDIESAERDILQALALDDEDPEFALSLARLMLATERVEQALEVMNGVIGEGHEASLEALLFRSHLHLVSGQNKEANADAMRASNRFPDEAFAFVQLANVQLAQGNTSMALRAAERAIGLDSDMVDGYLARGTALHMNGKSAEARQDLERASATPAELPMFLLGPVYELSGGGLDNSLLEMLGQTSKPAGGAGGMADAFAALGVMGGLPGMGGMDPMAMLGQMFDESGNIRGPLKPLLEMALKNAPKIMENMPDHMKANLAGVDPAKLDMSNLSADDIQEQMRAFYKQMKSSQDPKKPGGDDE